VRLCHHQLNVAYVTLDKGRLAVAEVQVPQPVEGIGQTLIREGMLVGGEICAPAAQSFGVVKADVLEVDNL